METITYSKLNREKFNSNSLDNFKRYQEVKECWRKIDNQIVLVSNEFIEDWDLKKCKNVAEDILKALDLNKVIYGAYYCGKVIGLIYLDNKPFGSDNQYIELLMFHVSEPFRKMGIGKMLFKLACTDTRQLGISKLYISAHSSKETQEAYRKLGCINAVEVNKIIADNEPFDIQMEYQL